LVKIGKSWIKSKREENTMGFLPSGGFCITTTKTFNHHQGISDDTLKKIVDLLKTEVTKKDSEIAKVSPDTVRSISIFARPAKS
jgi:hypothetical protein